MELNEAWIRLLHLPGIGAIQQNQLLDRFGSPEAIFSNAAQSDLNERIKSAIGKPNLERVEVSLNWLDNPQNELVTRNSERYPKRLKLLRDAPPLLFAIGDTQLLSTPQIAIVGSRNPSQIGAENAHEFARYFASVGITVTSGLALGIDTKSHDGALKGDGATIAVLGTGPDRVYPASNRNLAHQIIEKGGLLITEFAPGTQPVAGNFPKRNRIISGLSLGTLVVEAALRSGSLITARLAAEQGREVFAIPGSIHNPLARGCHRLIKDGAKLVETAADVLEELAPQLKQELLSQSIEGELQEPHNEEAQLDSEYLALLQLIGDGPTSIDQLIETSGLTANVVSSMLLQLELQGHIALNPGGYSRITYPK
ncbi:MAG: DNA-protecting protein DprA [Gammaproteobacteria bacterium]|nr:DNA-protecting protein DprA [Gammaproteobacteria bacterium]